jgi:hypothetical protein
MKNKILGVYKRPMHCVDTKRHKIYIKQNDKWEHDKEHKQFNKSIHKMQNSILKNWEHAHPSWYENEEESEYYLPIISKLEEEIDKKKCIRVITQMITIDKSL